MTKLIKQINFPSDLMNFKKENMKVSFGKKKHIVVKLI